MDLVLCGRNGTWGNPGVGSFRTVATENELSAGDANFARPNSLLRYLRTMITVESEKRLISYGKTHFADGR